MYKAHNGGVQVAANNYVTDELSMQSPLAPLASNEVIYLESLRKKGSSLLKFAADYRP